MAKPFYIGGLPRSRTAWLSVIATTGRSVCGHEVSKDFDDFAQLAAAWVRPPHIDTEFVGISDSGLGLHVQRILQEIGPRTLIIDRDIEMVRLSLRRYMSGLSYDEAAGDAFLTRLQRALDSVAKHPLVLRIPYEKLNDATSVQHAMAWLLPGVNMAHVDPMMRLNVQVQRSALIEELARVKDYWVLKDTPADDVAKAA